MAKKRMSKGAFLGVWCPVAALCLGFGIAIQIAGDHPGLKTILDTYVNKGKAHVTEVEGSENWDTNYYSQTYPSSTADGGNADAKANGEKTVEKIADEGMVLIKNKESALPLTTAASKKITLLGRGSVDPVYGGSGSGNVDTTTCSNPRKGLEAAGLEIDTGAYDFFNANYSKYDRQNITMDNYGNSTFFIGEIPASTYSFTVNSTNTAVVFISRCGGEGLDLSTNLKRDSQTSASKSKINSNANTAAEVANYADDQHQLELSKEEKDMIAFAKSNYDKVVIVLNESTTMEIGDLMDDAEIDAIIWAGSPGSTGFNSLGKILAGTVNPSGKTPDIYVRDFTADPTFKNFAINGSHEYSDIDESKIPTGVDSTKKFHFVQYEEGIYVGYRYYETRATIEGEDWYKAQVAVPFGYGLSYTTFTKELVDTQTKSNEIVMTVKVTNSGAVAGKEVVQLYYTAPYTAGGLEKSSTVLADFAKTKLLEPGASEEVQVKVAIDEMASYDYANAKAWVLDAGDYLLQIKEDSHNVSKKDNVALEYKYKVNSKRVLEKKESDKVKVTNQFDDISAIFKSKAADGYARLMSRNNFQETFPTSPTIDDTFASDIQILGKSLDVLFETFDWSKITVEDAKDPIIGADNGLTLSSMRGIPYEDEAWDLLLDQLTADDYKNINEVINNCAYSAKGIKSIGMSDAELHDGPQGFSTLFGKLNNVCAYMSEPLLAATFNKELAKEMGKAIGEEALALNPRYVGWYGPAMNTHRSPFAGRNFEYYSEDGVLAGKIAAEVVSGAADKGLVGFIKHFALNDQETWRTAHLATWADEQTLREIYLKPFEICVKTAKTNVKHLDSEGKMLETEMLATTGVMSSFNYIGSTWAGGSRPLMHNVLRDEWGFRGVVSSDFNLYDYMNPQQGTWAGTDLQLTWLGTRLITDTTSAAGRTVIREAVHNVAYALVNSCAMQGVAPGSTVWYEISPWRIWLYIAEGVFFAGAVASVAWIVVRMIKVKKESEIASA